MTCINLSLVSENQPSGKAYAIGSGESFGELGLGECRLVVNRPTLIEVLKEEDITDVQSSAMHSLVLTKEGKVSRQKSHSVYSEPTGDRSGVGEEMSLVRSEGTGRNLYLDRWNMRR